MKQEKFNNSKFIQGFFSLTSPVLWIKDLANIFNIRKILIYGAIILAVLAYGYYIGYKNRPINIDLGYGKEVIMVLGEEQIHITKNGQVFLENVKTGKVVKQIAVKDIPNLKSKLSAWGFQLKPILVGGYSIGTSGEATGEVGVGISFFRYWKMQAEAFITSHPAIYVGTSYNITENSGVGLAIGKSLKDFNDTRIIIYGRINF